MKSPGSLSPVADHEGSVEMRSPEARSLGFSGQDPLFARGLHDGRILVREGKDGEQDRVLPGNGAAVTSLAFSPDGAYLASGFQDGTVRLWDPRSGHELASRRDHTSPVDTFTFSPDGGLLASGGRDSRLLVYDVPGARTLYDLTSLASDVDTTQWIWVVAPVKVKTNEVFSSGITGGSEAPGLRQDLWAMTARSSLSVGPASPQRTTGDVIFRPARIYAETEYAEPLETRNLERSENASKILKQADTVLRSQDPVRGSLLSTESTAEKVLRQSESELVVAVTLSLELSANFRDTSVKSLLFRLSPCAGGYPCSPPELTLGSSQEGLLQSVDNQQPLVTAMGRSQRILSEKVIELALEERRSERSWHSYSYHLPMALFGLLAPRPVERAELLHENVRRGAEEFLMRDSTKSALVDAQASGVQTFVAFTPDSSVVSWVSESGLVHILDLRENRHLQVFPFVEGLGQGEWRAHLLGSRRVKSFSSSWSKWEIRYSDLSFLLVRVFLENLLQRESFLPLAGVYLSSGETIYRSVGVMDPGIYRQDGLTGVSMQEHEKEDRVFVFVVPHPVESELKLHILDLPPMEIVDQPQQPRTKPLQP